MLVLPELGVLCRDHAHLELGGLEVNGEDGGQTGDGRLRSKQKKHSGKIKLMKLCFVHIMHITSIKRDNSWKPP